MARGNGRVGPGKHEKGDSPEMAAHKLKARRQGYMASAEGMDEGRNPWPFFTALGAAWAEGWRAHQQEEPFPGGGDPPAPPVGTPAPPPVGTPCEPPVDTPEPEPEPERLSPPEEAAVEALVAEVPEPPAARVIPFRVLSGGGMGPVGAPSQQELVDVLEQTLALVRAGHVDAGVFIVRQTAAHPAGDGWASVVSAHLPLVEHLGALEMTKAAVYRRVVERGW